ncbi:MAG: glycerol-3-phosphate 1-O-acyltransferase PlsY [Thermotogae bacterium]|nr:glycerol-3-phosphate 1-O-acyltransferase PlsY [Thermotogota bacterium]
MIQMLLWGVIGYFFGSIPFSYIIPLLRGVDVRKVGSGNVGGTNALRAAGFPWGVIAMFLDGAKGFIPSMIALHYGGMVPSLIAATAAVVGHDYPVWLGFKGGKGVGSTVGAYFAICPLGGWGFLGSWLLFALTTKIVSISSLIGLSVAAVIGFVVGGPQVGSWGVVMLLLSIFQHRSNISRLLRGTERRTDLVAMVKRGVRR